MTALAIVAAVALTAGLAALDARRIRRNADREPLFPVFDEWRKEQERP